MHARIRRYAACALVIAGALLVPDGARAAEVPTIAAAASLQFALPDIAAAFKRSTGHDVRISFGSSGNFRRQIADGAPFELFLSADTGYVDALVRERRTVDAGIVYAVGQLALFVPNGSPVKADPALRDVAAALADGRLRKFAIANPELAPYGEAARQALEHAGLWAAIKPHLVLGESVSQAAQFAASGAAQAGIVACSLVKSPGMEARGHWAVLPAGDHAPIRQKMVLLKGAGPTARAFAAFVQSAEARAILSRYGFDPPDSPGAASAASDSAKPPG